MTNNLMFINLTLTLGVSKKIRPKKLCPQTHHVGHGDMVDINKPFWVQAYQIPRWLTRFVSFIRPLVS